jgi:signal transduction histidine kinase
MHELVTFASPDKPKLELLDIRTEVQSLVNFIDREMTRQQIAITTHFAPSPAQVRFDPDRLRQILLNLMQNAEQALRGPGQIDISITSDAERVRLRIADNGPGIPEEDRQRIFEPFYSTKANGSGLGLALVRRFVTEADGTITCENNSPQGTIFRIELPRAAGVKKGS